MTDRPGQLVIERDIDFDAVFSMVRMASRKEAEDLLHSALKVAFNNGEAFGMESMAQITDRAFDQAMRSHSSTICHGE